MERRQKEMPGKPPLEERNHGKGQRNNQTAANDDQVIRAKDLNAPMVEPEEAHDTLVHELRMRPLWATFRNILLVVFLIFVCAILQMFLLWRVCNAGMNTAESMEFQGLPTLQGMATLQQHLAIYRLNAYEYLFARVGENAK